MDEEEDSCVSDIDLELKDESNWKDIREEELGFRPQRDIVYNNLLPYKSKLDEESTQWFKEIKYNLGQAIALRELRPGVFVWISRLNRYIRLYSLKFPVEDHVTLIRLMYSLLTSPDLEPGFVNHVAGTLYVLLKKNELLTPEQLNLDWRPLFDLQKRYVYTKLPSLGLLNLPQSLPNNVRNVIRVCRPYFSIEATKEMMEDWRPLLCPLDVTFGEAVTHMALFLPTHQAYLNPNATYKVWLEEMTTFWESCGNRSAWESQFVNLLARLASSTTGLIDWNPYLPRIFARIKQMFHLPVKFKQLGTGSKGSPMDDLSAARWIVATLGRTDAGESETQLYLTKLFGSVDSYFHPANIGGHCTIMTGFMNKLTNLFVARINSERYKKPKWGHRPAKEHCLSDQDITTFVETLLPAALQSMWSKFGFLDAGVTLQNLATLRPELVLPTLTERFSAALEVITEPHKLTASLHSMIGISRSLVTFSKFYPQGQTLVLPLLFSTLPGIDTNDPRKSMLTFQYIATYATLIPFVDFSTASNYHTLTEEQHQISLQSSQFEDFLADFCDRCFAIIENSIVLQTRSEVAHEDLRGSREDTMTNVSMASTLQTILMQSSIQVYNVALNKIKTFITGRILECKVSGKIAAGLVKCLVRVRPEIGLKAFLPTLCDNILASIDCQTGADMEGQAKFQLQILSKIVSVPGRYLLSYIPQLVAVLDKTLVCLGKEEEELSGALLKNVLRSLSLYCPTDYKSTVSGFDRPISEYLPLDDWGACVAPKDIEIDWNIPDRGMIDKASEVLARYLDLEVDRLNSWMAGNISLNKDELKHSITVILCLIQGVGSQLPFWDGKIVQHQHSETNMQHHKHVVTFCDSDDQLSRGISYKEEHNMRKFIVDLMHKLLKHISVECPDRTKSLTNIIAVFQAVLFWNGVTKEEYEARNKSFQAVKKVLDNKLLGNKKNIRPIFVDRTHLQHETRLVENVNRDFTESHQQLFHDIVDLATSYYSVVRIKAQELIGKCHRHFAFSYKVVLPRLLLSLNTDDGNVSHEQYKGALYVMLGHGGKSLANKCCWQTFEKVCPAILTSSLSEKPSIIKVWSKLVETIFNHMDTFAVRTSLDDSVINLAMSLWDNGSKLTPSGEKPAATKIETGLQRLEKISQDNLDSYDRIIHKLCDLLESGDLHWKRYKSGVLIVATILRYDINLPERAVKLLANNLCHENLEVRKTSIFIMAGVLRLQKRSHVLVDKKLAKQQDPVLPGVRPDNQWMIYTPENFARSKDDWNKPNYVHKTHWGYYKWPMDFKVYAPESEQPSLDRGVEDMKPEERHMFQIFHNQEMVDEIVRFFSLEEQKDMDKFDSRKFMLWKGLFRNYGDSVLTLLKPHIERLSLAENESSQRCGAEMIAGLIRGVKHWPWDMTERLWGWLVPLLRKILMHMTVETVRDWGTCMATASESRDPNRIHWLLEVLMEEPLRSQGSFLDSSRLYVLQGALAQQEWRCGSLLHKLNHFLGPFLNHPYHNVRERIGSILTNIYACDFDYPLGSGATSSPTVKQLVQNLLPRLEIMRTEPDPELYNFHKNSAKNMHSFDTACLTSLPAEMRDLVEKFGTGALIPPAGGSFMALPPGIIPSVNGVVRPMLALQPSNVLPGGMLPHGMAPPPGGMLPNGMNPPPGGMLPHGMTLPPGGMLRPGMAPPGGMLPPEVVPVRGMLAPRFVPVGRMLPPGVMLPSRMVSPPNDNTSANEDIIKESSESSADENNLVLPSSNLQPSSDNSIFGDVETNSKKVAVQDSHVSFDPELQKRWDERQAGVRLLQTVCKFIIGILSRNLYPMKAELFEFLPMLCLNESNELEPELARDCTTALSVMSGTLLSPELIPKSVEAIKSVCQSQSWKGKVCGLEFLQVQIFTNFAVFISVQRELGATQTLVDIVMALLQDPQLEVREKAGAVLGGLVHCGFITAEQREAMTTKFTAAANKKLKRWKDNGGAEVDKVAWQTKHNAALIKRHAGVLGLCSVVSACPYDIPSHLPEVLMVLGDHLHDPHPIPGTVKKVLQEFKRTHQDNWTEHKERFTEDQLNVLTDLLVSPSYYA